VYLHLAKESPNNVNDKMSMQKLNSIWHELNGKLFKRAVHYLNETLELYVLKLYEPLEDTKNDISFELAEVNEIDLSSESNSKKQTSADLFSIVKVESVFNLKLSVKENEPIDSNLYLIEVNICLKTFSAFENQENANTFVKNCRMASFNLKINFKLDLFELRFSKNEYQINLIQFEGDFYNEQLKSLSPIKPIVDLKAMIQNRNLFNLDKLIQSALVEFNFDASVNKNELVISSNPNNNSLFYLDKVNGNVYAASLEDIFASKLNAYEIEVYLKHSSLVQSKAVIKFVKIKQTKEFNSSIVIKINEDAETGRILWTNLMKLNLSIQLNESSKIELNCFDLEQFVCNSLFKLNPKSDYLMVSKSYAVDYLFKANLNTIKQFKVRLQLAITSSQMSRIEFDVNVDLDFIGELYKPTRIFEHSTSTVQLLNSTERNVKFFLLDKRDGLDLSLVRVKNLITNSKVIGLSYNLALSDRKEYFLEVQDSLEQNQLYSFDFELKLNENGDQVIRSSYFMIRLSSLDFKTSSLKSIRKYLSFTSIKSVRANLTQLELENYKFTNENYLVQKIYLIDRIEANSRANVNLIDCFRLDADQLTFKSDLTKKNSSFNYDMFGTSFNVRVYKFLVDKISLKIFKIVSFEIVIEIFPTSKQLSLPFYFKSISLKNSDLLKKSKLNNDIELFQMKNQNDELEYEIDYKTNIPFEINRLNGRISYLIGEDVASFNQNNEKDYKFSVIVRDVYSDEKKVWFEVKIINDDPLVQFRGLVNYFYINENTPTNFLIGQLNFRNSSTELSSGNLKFYLLNDSAQSNEFCLSEQTGLLYSKKQISSQQEKFYKFNAKVNGTIGHRSVYFVIEVFVVVNKLMGLNEIESSNKIIKFSQSKYEFYISDRSKIQIFKLNYTSFASKDKIRFKAINQLDANSCELNWYNGLIYCNSDELAQYACYKKEVSYSFNVIAYDLDDKYLKTVDLTNVNINLNKSHCKSDMGASSTKQTLNKNELYRIKYTIQVFANVGALVANLYELIKLNYNIDIDLSQNRVFLIEDSSLFEIDSISADLRLARSLDQDLSAITLKFKIYKLNKSIAMEADLSASINEFTVSLELSIELDERDYAKISTLNPFYLSESFVFNIDLDTVINLANKNSLFKLGQIQSYLFKSKQLNERLISKNFVAYYLESSVSNQPADFNIDSLVSQILADSMGSLVYINKTNGVLWVNISKLAETNLAEVDFNVYIANSLQNLTSKFLFDPSSKASCKLKISYENKLDLVAFRLGYLNKNEIKIEKTIQSNKFKLGIEVVNLNYILFNSYSNKLRAEYEVEPVLESNTEIPFMIDPKNASLILKNCSSLKQTETYRFSIRLSKHFRINMVIVLKPSFKISSMDELMLNINRVKQVINFKLSKTCIKNHFIGSLNNFNNLINEQVELKFITNRLDLDYVTLNETSGDLFCNENAAEQSIDQDELQIEILAKLKREPFAKFIYLKSLSLSFEFYESYKYQSNELNGYFNEKLVFEIKLSENNRVETSVWSLPFSINLRFKYFQLIAGNVDNSFYLDKSSGNLMLIAELDYTKTKQYKLLIRCINTQESMSQSYEYSNEFDIELNIEIVRPKSDLYSAYAMELPVFEKPIYELNLNIDDFNKKTPILKLNAFYSMSDSYTNRITYHYLDSSVPVSNKNQIENFKSLFILNEFTGEVLISSPNPIHLIEYCELANEIGLQNTNLLLNIKAYNQFDDASYATALLQLNPNCDSSYTSKKIDFQKPFYFARVHENTNAGTFVAELRLEQFSNQTNFYFCMENLKKLNPQTLAFSIDKTGSVYTNQVIDRESQSLYSYDVCASLSDNLNKNIVVQTKLFIYVEDVNDNEPKLTIFEDEESDFIEIDIPITRLSSNSPSLNLFRLNMSDKDSKSNGLAYIQSETSSSNIFSVNSTTGWLVLNKKELQPSQLNLTHLIKVNAVDMGEPSLKSKQLDLIIRFTSVSQDRIDLNVQMDASKSTKLISLKSYFKNSFKYLVLAYLNDNIDQSCSNCLAYNTTDGIVYLSNSLNSTNVEKTYKFELKYVSKNSDLRISIIYLNIFTGLSTYDSMNANSKTAVKVESFNVLISAKTFKNSVIFDLNAFKNQTEPLDSKVQLDQDTAYANLFEIDDSTSSKLLLKGNLTYLTIQTIQLSLKTANTNKNILLNVHILENMLENLRFSSLNYNFEYGAKEKTNLLGQIEIMTSNFDNKRFDLDNFIKFESLSVHDMLCQTEGVDLSKYITNTFRLKPNNNKIDILVDSLVQNLPCDVYSFRVEAAFSSHLFEKKETKSIETYISVKINDLKQLKLDLNSAYNKTINTNNKLAKSSGTISLFELIGFNRQANGLVKFKAILVQSSIKSVDYQLNTINGLLSVSFSNEDLAQKYIKFEVICYTENANEFNYIKKFYLYLFIAENSQKLNFSPFFTQNYIEVAHIQNDLNSKVYNINNLVYGPAGYGDFDVSNLVLSDVQFKVDKYGYLTYNQANEEQQCYPIDYIKLVNVKLCKTDGSRCDECLIAVKLISNQTSDGLNDLNFKLTSTSLSVLKKYNQINLVKLRSAGNYKFRNELASVQFGNGFSAEINYQTGVLALKRNEASRIIASDRANVSVYLNSTNAFSIDFDMDLNDEKLEARNDLVIDFYVIKNLELDNHKNIGIFIGNVGPLAKTNRFECEFWSYNENAFRLSKSCDLFLVPEFLSSISSEISLKLRVYDTKFIKPSIFYDVRVNIKELKQAHLNSSNVLVEFYFKNESLANELFVSKLNNYLNLKLNSNLMAYERSTRANLILIRPTSLDLNQLVVKLKKMENAFQIEIANVSTFNLMQSSSIPAYSQLINTNEYILNMPEFDLHNINNIIQFDKLSYLKYENFNLTNADYMQISYSFKLSENANQETNQFMFYSLFSSGYLSSNINNFKLEFKHNLSNSSSSVCFSNQLELNVWHKVEIEKVGKQLKVELKKLDMASKALSLINSSQVYLEAGRNDLFMRDLYIGGFDKLNEIKLSNKEYFADDISIADFKLNNYELFDKENMKNLAKENKIQAISSVNLEQCELESSIWSDNCSLGKIFEYFLKLSQLI
jgi:hypothetical protein